MALALRRKTHESIVYIDKDSAPRIMPFGEDFILEDIPIGTRVIYPNPPIKGLPNREAAIRYAVNHPLEMEPLYALLEPGTAALFVIALYFKKHKPEHLLVLAVFDGEEKGLMGSGHFVTNLPVKKEAILLNINMDMISRNDKGELYATGTFHYPQFKSALEVVWEKSKIKLLLGHDDSKLGREDWTNQFEHAPFHRENIPFIYFGVEDHKDYHARRTILRTFSRCFM